MRASIVRSIDRAGRHRPSRLRNTDSISQRFRARSDCLTKLEYVNVSRPRAVLHRKLTEILFDADAPRDAVEVDSFDRGERREYRALKERVKEFLD